MQTPGHGGLSRRGRQGTPVEDSVALTAASRDRAESALGLMKYVVLSSSAQLRAS